MEGRVTVSEKNHLASKGILSLLQIEIAMVFTLIYLPSVILFLYSIISPRIAHRRYAKQQKTKEEALLRWAILNNALRKSQSQGSKDQG